MNFQECDTCIAKPGTPALCKGCLHNREAIRLLTNGLQHIMAGGAAPGKIAEDTLRKDPFDINNSKPLPTYASRLRVMYPADKVRVLTTRNMKHGYKIVFSLKSEDYRREHTRFFNPKTREPLSEKANPHS